MSVVSNSRTLDFAQRMSRLGTETAFAVSAEAAAFAAEGNKIYPFHIGDLNLPTPDNVVAATDKAMRAGKTGYGSNYGLAELRAALAANINASHGTSYSVEHVLVQPGGKPVIGKFFLALLEPGDEALYPNPGYPIYESQIEFNGGKAVPYGYREGSANFEIDLAGLERAITPRTRFLVFNNLQNPTGAESSRAELEQVAEIARKHDLMVLCDEAYQGIVYGAPPPSLASLPGMAERTVILYTFSKTYAMTGWRLGAAIGPKALIDAMAKLAVNDESCTNTFIQYGGIEALTGDQSGSRNNLAILQERRDIAVDLLNSIPGFRCFKPGSTFYLFPNVTAAMAALGTADYEAFRRRVLKETGVSFTTRMHFGRPGPDEPQRYVRLAYSGIDKDQIHEGLTRLKEFMTRA